MSSDVRVSSKDGCFVSQQYDQSEQQDRERANLEARFPVSPADSKIVKERIWINPVTSKIVRQPLEPDTDAQLHKERVITVRKPAKFVSRVLLEQCPRWNEHTLETSCRCDVEEFQEEIKVAQQFLHQCKDKHR